MTRHLSDEQLRGFVGPGLAPAELLAAGEHLAECEVCRRRGAALGDADRRLSEVRSGLQTGHLAEDAAERLVSGDLPAAERTRVAEHLAECPICAAEVRELETWVRRRARRARAPYAYAAAAVLIVGVAVTVWLAGTPSVDFHPSLVGLGELPQETQDRVRAALSAGAAEPPPVLAELSGVDEALMGRAEGEVFRALDPPSGVVLSDRPTFRWEPLAGAWEYTVAVFDVDLLLVATSPPVSGTAWTPESSLPRGQTLLWQVTAERGDERVTAPAPPAAPAKFVVLDAETAAVLERLGAEHPGSHLLLGILLAQAGAADEAERHLRRVPEDDRYAGVARATLERLARPAGRK